MALTSATRQEELQSLRDAVEETKLDEDAQFAAMVRQTIDVLAMHPGLLGNACRVSIPCVNRWKNGITSPALGMRGAVRRSCLRLIDAAAQSTEESDGE